MLTMTVSTVLVLLLDVDMSSLVAADVGPVPTTCADLGPAVVRVGGTGEGRP